MEKCRSHLEHHQIKIYFLAILIGAILGLKSESMNDLSQIIHPALIFMLYVTFLQVPISEVRQAFKQFRFILALLSTNFIALPILIGILSFMFPSNNYSCLAILLVLLVPCIDYVITFTHLGQGNSKLLLAITPLLLIAQMFLLPIYLTIFLNDNVAKLIQLDAFLHAFIGFIIVPLILAAFTQYLTNKYNKLSICKSTLNLMPVPATACVLFLVLASVMPQIGLAKDAALSALPIYILFACIAPCIGGLMAKVFKLNNINSRSIVFSASYRNSLVILPLALAIPKGMPIVPAVILTQTIVELCFLPLYLRIIPKLFPIYK